MAITDKISEEALASVLKQINENIAGVTNDLFSELENVDFESEHSGEAGESKKKPEYRLDDTFAVWTLSAEAARQGARGEKELIDLAKDSGYWHHQISMNGKRLGYGRSLKTLYENTENWNLTEIGVSRLAEAIQEACIWSNNNNVSDDYLARLLLVPAFQFKALWFVNELDRSDLIYVITTPIRPWALRKGQALSSKEFLEGLGKEREISGLRPT